jgi:ABC-type lipoprotein export system ATPase subunit
MDNLPQVRLDIQHLYYYASSERRRRRWPWLWDWWRRPSSAVENNIGNDNTHHHDHDPPQQSVAVAAHEHGGGDGVGGDGNNDKEKAPAAILDDISLSFTPGQLLGVMGPSGSGKTSLLRVLHGAPKYVGSVQGTVLVNGTPVRSIHSAFRKMCSFVPQEDVLLPNFTVHETLMFGAELRLPQGETREERRETVEAVIQELGLGDCRDVVVGGVETAGGISGGQRRRVSIGLELLTDPSVLLLDVRAPSRRFVWVGGG